MSGGTLDARVARLERESTCTLGARRLGGRSSTWGQFLRF